MAVVNVVEQLVNYFSMNLVEKFINRWFALFLRPKPKQAQAQQTCLIAHRGAHDEARALVENTDAAFAEALALGCWGIEFDVQVTADQTLVVHHDSSLLRIWQKPQVISQIPFSELRALVPAIPTLQEVITRYAKHMHLFIELKAPFHAEAVLVNCLKDLQPCIDYHLLSLDEKIFAELSAFPREALLLVPEHNNVEKFCQLSLSKPYGGVLGHYLLLSDNKIKRLQAAHQRVGVGFVDSKNSLYREINRGIDWIFTNNAQAVSAYLHALRKAW